MKIIKNSLKCQRLRKSNHRKIGNRSLLNASVFLFDKSPNKGSIREIHNFSKQKNTVMQRSINYLEQLILAAEKYKSNICFGFDPVLSSLAPGYASAGINGFTLQTTELFAYMKEQKVFPGAFKPNHGFYSKHDKPRQGNFKGSIALGNLLNLIEKEFPDMPTILDFKRGDIAKSSKNYAEEGFGGWDTDAVTVAPYMGTDSMMPFAEYCGTQLEKVNNRGAYILNLTSNKGAKDFEMQRMADGSPLFMSVANWIRDNAGKYPGLGAVVGAPDLTGLKDLARFYSETGVEVPLLIPGVSGLIPGTGGQGGKADEVMTMLKYVDYNTLIARINVSSGLTHPWGTDPAPDDWKKIIVDNLFQYNKLVGMA